MKSAICNEMQQTANDDDENDAIFSVLLVQQQQQQQNKTKESQNMKHPQSLYGTTYPPAGYLRCLVRTFIKQFKQINTMQIRVWTTPLHINTVFSQSRSTPATPHFAICSDETPKTSHKMPQR